MSPFKFDSQALEFKPLKDVAHVIMGQSPPSSAYNDERSGLPFFQGKTEFGSLHPTPRKWCSMPTKIAEPEDILMSIRAPVGPTNIAIERACIGRGLAAIRPKDGLRVRWLLYAFRAMESKIDSLGTGTTFKAISGDVLRHLEVPIAPLAYQDQAIEELEKQFSRLDEAVANLQRVKANLKRYKASVLKAAVEGRLVETEATLARREGRTYETGEQLLQRILEERRANWIGRGKYKEPESTRIEHTFDLPEGWAWATLGHLSLSVKDGPHYSPKYVDEGIPFISGGNVRPEGIDFKSAKYITTELHQELSKRCKPEVGDLLYTKGGTTGIARINTDPREFNVWVHVAVLKLAEPLHRFYVQHALNSQHCYRQAQEYTHGVGNQDLGLTRMVWITVPLPPQAEQARIVAEVDRHLSIIREVEAEVDANLQRAQALRQAVLAKSFQPL
ncbi:MAG: restriction endonuclease subunit S [Burkholderiaceae bacterium]